MRILKAVMIITVTLMIAYIVNIILQVAVW